MLPAFFHCCPSPTQERLDLSKSIKAAVSRLQAVNLQACQVPLIAPLLLQLLLLQRPAEVLSLSDTTFVWMTWMLCRPVGLILGWMQLTAPKCCQLLFCQGSSFIYENCLCST